MGLTLVLSGCIERKTNTPADSAPPSGSMTPTGPVASTAPPVEIWLGIAKYDAAIAGLKVGDVAQFSGRISDGSTQHVVIVHVANRYDERNYEVGPKPTPIAAAKLSQEFAANKDEALKKYVVALESSEGEYIVEGTITELDGSLYKVILK